MTNREIILTALHHEEAPVPQWNMGFFNRTVAERLVPGLVYPSYYFIPAQGEYDLGPMTEAELEVVLAFNAAIDKCSVGVGRGANSSFGHGGPGEFRGRIVEHGENHFLVRYETGAEHYYQINPHNYHIVKLPVTSLEALIEPVLPDPDDPARYTGFAHDVAWFKSKDVFTHGHINGFFSGLHYFFLDYPEVLMGFLGEPAAMRRLVDLLGNWNLTAAQHMLEAGVDCITLCDDLGTSESMLISPAVFREFVKPWYSKLNALVHSFPDRYTHLHSHGNINAILPDLAEVGFDMLNPLDPNDGMNLASVKAQWGKKITLVGGLEKHFFKWDVERQYQYLKKSISAARCGGGFILMEPGGVPETVTLEQWQHFDRMSREVRQ
jgi:uroporphyrinogen decarboxylase